MASTAQSRLIDSIRRIAKTDPEIRSTLTLLRDRGILEAVTSTVGVGETIDGTEDCCDEGDPDPGEEEEETSDGNDGTIDGERPDDGQNEKNMDGRFRGPDGEFFGWDDCTPDETWEEGTYWWNGTYHAAGATVRQVCRGIPTLNKFLGISYSGGGYAECIFQHALPPHRPYPVEVIRIGCGSSTEDYCQLTSAPCAEYEVDWPMDGKCQEALIDGKFHPHPSDPDCAGRGPRDYQIMCDSEHCIAYIPTADGGHMRVEVDPVTRLPIPGSDMKYYGSDGRFKSSTEYRYDNVKYNAYSENSVPGNWGD